MFIKSLIPRVSWTHARERHRLFPIGRRDRDCGGEWSAARHRARHARLPRRAAAGKRHRSIHRPRANVPYLHGPGRNLQTHLGRAARSRAPRAAWRRRRDPAGATLEPEYRPPDRRAACRQPPSARRKPTASHRPGSVFSTNCSRTSWRRSAPVPRRGFPTARSSMPSTFADTLEGPRHGRSTCCSDSGARTARGARRRPANLTPTRSGAPRRPCGPGNPVAAAGRGKPMVVRDDLRARLLTFALRAQRAARRSSSCR